MITSRHRARGVALQFLFQFETQANPAPHEPRALAQALQNYFDHFEVLPGLREFAAYLVSGTLMNQESLDQELAKATANWRLERLSQIDRSLLRMSLFELIHTKDIPASVTLNEAVELAKEFGTSDSPAFINGILDALAKKLAPEKK